MFYLIFWRVSPSIRVYTVSTWVPWHGIHKCKIWNWIEMLEKQIHWSWLVKVRNRLTCVKLLIGLSNECSKDCTSQKKNTFIKIHSILFFVAAILNCVIPLLPDRRRRCPDTAWAPTAWAEPGTRPPSSWCRLDQSGGYSLRPQSTPRRPCWLQCLRNNTKQYYFFFHFFSLHVIPEY